MPSDRLTPSDLAEMRARCDAATEGCWKAQYLEADGMVINRGGFEISTPGYDVCAEIPRGAPIRKEADALFIAHAKDDLPRLLDEVEKLRAERDGLAFGKHVVDSVAGDALAMAQTRDAECDRLRAELADIRTRLDGHPDSRLDGEGGLAAATMRELRRLGDVVERLVSK